MSRLLVRVLLLIICGTAIAGAGFLLWSSTRIAATDAVAAREFDLRARAARSALADLRSAQQSYVAEGQGADFWFGRVTEIAKDLDSTLSALGASAKTSDAGREIAAAATAFQEFMQMDLRAREYVRGHQLTLASDMVFADGFDLTRKAGDAVDRALTAEQVGRDAAEAALRRRDAGVLGGAAAIALLCLILMVPVAVRQSEPAPAPVAAPRAPVAVKATEVRQASAARPPAAAPRPIALDRVASLCSELARVPDTPSLPALLERTLSVLDATGLVLWIADPDGRELAPILVHGYPPQLATRLGTIARDAENVTASAYRTGLLQTMKADEISNGAIAVPLVGPGGCVGVMAAEMKNGGERQDALLAAATIIAAQLATLVGPPAVRTRTEAAG